VRLPCHVHFRIISGQLHSFAQSTLRDMMAAAVAAVRANGTSTCGGLIHP